MMGRKRERAFSHSSFKEFRKKATPVSIIPMENFVENMDGCAQTDAKRIHLPTHIFFQF